MRNDLFRVVPSFLQRKKNIHIFSPTPPYSGATHLHVGDARRQVLVLRLSQVRVGETRNGILDALYLAGHNGQYLDGDAVKLVEAPPRPDLGETCLTRRKSRDITS